MTTFQWVAAAIGMATIVGFCFGFFAGGYFAARDWQDYWDWYVSTMEGDSEVQD